MNAVSELTRAPLNTLVLLAVITLHFGVTVGCGGGSNPPPPPSPLVRITGSISPNAANGMAYSSTDQATGGTPAYTWSIALGALPPGLNLAATTGTISGTPNQNGTYNFTMKVVDSDSPPQSATQANQITVVTPAPVWSLQSTAKGWNFVAPDSSVTCKYNAVSLVDTHSSAIQTKYGSWANWALQQSNRLKSLGFTAAGYYSFAYQSNWQSGMLPDAPSWGGISQDALTDTQSYHVKDILWIPQPGGMRCGTSIYQGVEADPYDPNTQKAFNGSLLTFVSEYGGGFSHAIIIIPDEADFLFGLDKANGAINSHADLGLVVASNTPMMQHSRPGGGGNYNGGNFSFPDGTVAAKTAMRDYLLNEYLCTDAGVPISTCTGSKTGTGSADPASASYVGAGNASTALTDLNTAWGTSYSTWNTSDLGGLTAIANGTYASWGGNAACTASGTPYACCTGRGTGSCMEGTGLLDENGSHIISSSQSCGGLSGNGPQQNENWSTVTQIETDLHLFVGQLAATYASKARNGWLAACGTSCPPEALPVYDGPTYAYSNMAPYTDLFWISPGEYSLVNAAASDVQTIINNAGGKPVIVANYFMANPDSWNNSACPSQQGQDCQKTQASRGALITSLGATVLPLKNPNGKYAVVGLEHWSLYDSFNDYGLFTPNDNGYDGSAASTATSSGACLTNHAYAQPAICLDLNNNYEGLAVSSCTSGSTAPTWNTNYNGLTKNDGSCTWFNEGPYPPTPESANWGDALLPIANFLTAGICDP